MRHTRVAAVAGAAILLSAPYAIAAQPTDWEMGFQPAATAIMAQIDWFADYTMWFVVPITLLVLGLLAYIAIKFRASVHPVPSRTSHNTLIEVIWTVGPVVVLLFIAVPSFQLLTAQYSPPDKPALTVKVTGHQWYWSYDYQDNKNVSFDSLLLQAKDRKAADKTDLSVYPRLLAVDNEMVVPVGKTVRLLITSGDVIHSFKVPSFGIMMDAVPGRLNEDWFKVEKPGLYYGQCSELCGQNHAFMPIAVRAVTEEQYKAWVTAAAKDLGTANKALMASIAASNSKTAEAAGAHKSVELAAVSSSDTISKE
ncbi:MAG TPA: cytochrome c oxidase subunit II [Pararhizobium sp.]|nr:cytochrome c oxidase subunit II [Pararhizobium sp.]